MEGKFTKNGGGNYEEEVPVKGFDLDLEVFSQGHQRRLKGLGHEMNIFLEADKYKSVVSVHAHMVFLFLAALKFLLASKKTLTNYKNCSETRIINF